MNNPKTVTRTDLKLLAQQALLQVLWRAEIPLAVRATEGDLLTIDSAGAGFQAKASVPEERRSRSVPLQGLAELRESIAHRSARRAAP